MGDRAAKLKPPASLIVPGLARADAYAGSVLLYCPAVRQRQAAGGTRAMGREAVVQAEVGSEAGAVRALLESRELILRGDIRRTFPLSALSRVEVVQDALTFTNGAEQVRLILGASVAARWARAMTEPPPSLRTKLGLAEGARVFCIGQIDDPALAEALDGAVTDDLSASSLVVARIDRASDLEGLLAGPAARADLPVWTVYFKGAKAEFGDGPIRARMREVGFVDSKSCAVSERLTATRYGRRKT